ncbi:MAG: hypothetical protein WCK95_05565 [Alphaproteobacteria bacterium]|jgi:hypothetical protein
MDEFDDAIKLTEEASLARSLPATLRLSSTLADDDWSDWLRLELIGYFEENPSMTERVDVPSYRTVPGTWQDDDGRTLVVADSKMLFFNKVRLRFGVAELETFVSSGPITTSIRLPEQAGIVSSVLGVDVSTFSFERESVQQVLTKIRKKALEQLRRRKPAGIHVRFQKQDDTFLHRPSLWGMGVEPKALWKKLRRRALGR